MRWRGTSRPGASAAWVLFVALAASGTAACGDDENLGGNGGNGGEDGEGANGGNPDEGGGGTSGGGAPEGGGTPGEEFAGVAEGNTPLDATPSPDGERIYFTAIDPEEGGGVFAVPVTGGPIETLAVGLPFVTPFGIATGTDGDVLYIADPAADADGADGGLLLSLNSVGGNALAVEGSEGYRPVSLEVLSEGGTDDIYFSGRHPLTNQAGIFRIEAAGGVIEELAAGGEIADPSGVTVSKEGDVYFVDTIGSGSGTARVLHLPIGALAPTVVVDDLRVGYPAGIALTLDDSALWVSGLDADTLTDVVYIIDIADQSVTTYTGDDDTPISAFFEPAGLHRAKNVSVFAWADSKAGANGTVFAIQP